MNDKWGLFIRGISKRLFPETHATVLFSWFWIREINILWIWFINFSLIWSMGIRYSIWWISFRRSCIVITIFFPLHNNSFLILDMVFQIFYLFVKGIFIFNHSTRLKFNWFNYIKTIHLIDRFFVIVMIKIVH